MREIKFRGLGIYSGEWVVGDLFQAHDGGRFIFPRDVDPSELATFIGDEVRPETVGQYTGLKNRDGVEIYEGDVVKAIGIATMRNVAPVIFRRGQFGMEYDLLWDLGGFNEPDIEVIGNVHEHAHLLDS